jgi:formiminotetrahydrofolate cyclodeaminase
MGLESADQLKEFCLELSSDLPSPGGGTASAAAGAMAASLLIMVCGVTAKSKRHEASKPRLAELQSALERNRDELLGLAREDAEAYDSVVSAVRQRKSEPGSESDKSYQHALRHAADVPMRTSDVCVQVLEKAVDVANVGTKSASSDIGVAWELATAGFRGAKKNVIINLGGLEDKKYADVARRGLRMSEGRISDLERRIRSVPGILGD